MNYHTFKPSEELAYFVKCYWTLESPKQLSKTIRLQATLKMLLTKKFTSLTALAYENEYYDQAHFIKDFKDQTGFTPKEFYGSNLKMSSLFYGTD